MGFPLSAVGLAPSPNRARLCDEKRSSGGDGSEQWLSRTVGGAGVGDGIAPRGCCGMSTTCEHVYTARFFGPAWFVRGSESKLQRT